MPRHFLQVDGGYWQWMDIVDGDGGSEVKLVNREVDQM